MDSISKHVHCHDSLFCGLLFLAALCQVGKAQPAPEQRRVTVSDAIQMTSWSDFGYFLGGEPNGRVALFSPHKDKFVIVVKKGNLKRDAVDYSLLLFHSSNVLKAPQPQHLLTMSSSSNREGITHLKWLDDNRTIVFLGEDTDEMPQVYALNVGTSKVKKLTAHSTPIVAYDITSNGSTLVYEAVAKQSVGAEEVRKHGILVTSQQPNDLIECFETPACRTEKMGRALFVQAKGEKPISVPSKDFILEHHSLVLSPNGRYALLAVNLNVIPEAWSEYKEKLLHSFVVERRRPGSWSRVQQYMLLDTQSHTLSPLLDAPLSGVNRGFAWAPDSSSVVLSSTYLPLDVDDLREQEVRRQHTFVIDVELPSRQIAKIDDRNLNVVRWSQITGKIILGPESGRNSGSTYAFEKRSKVWKSVALSADDTNAAEPIAVSLEENSNTPPRIFASMPNGEKRILLLDLNPQFKSLVFGKVEAVTWKSTDGHTFVGGLYFPPGYTPGNRYPLVIQTHGFNKNRFWIDGPWSSAFAAQPLAAHDMIVLQVAEATGSEADETYIETPQEAPHQMAAFEGAIDYLDSRGLIDRQRVGIIGFSRTVFHVEYSLTHSTYHFAAASLVDGIDGGYINYLLWPSLDFVKVMGGSPNGVDISLWLKNSPGFNLDKVRAPVRLEYYDASYFLAGWQWFSGLSLLRKPVEYIVLPDGYHMLIKPWERLVSQQGTVDWFSFWLQGYERPNPEDTDQYKRWERLRELRDADAKATEQTQSNASKPN